MKTISLFISSTFVGMNDNRINLISYVFPKIKQKCDQKGIVFNYYDLRWGVRMSTPQYVLLDLCLRNIDQSHPLFIGMVGDEYGTWTPEIKNKNELQYLSSRYPDLKHYLDCKMSLTEMEMRHRLQKNEDSGVFIYLPKTSIVKKGVKFLLYSIFKKFKNYQKQQKLDKFKSYLESNFSSVCRFYDKSVSIDNNQSLVNIAERDLLNYITKTVNDIPVFSDNIKRTIQYNYLNTYSELHPDYEHDSLFEEIKDKIFQNQLMEISGTNTNGSLINFIKYFDYPSSAKFYYFTGLYEKNDTPKTILLDLLIQLIDYYGIKNNKEYDSLSTEEIRSTISSIISLNKKQRLFIVISGIDSVFSTKEKRACLRSWLPFVEEITYYIVSVRNKTLDDCIYCSASSYNSVEFRNAIQRYIVNEYNKLENSLDAKLLNIVYSNPLLCYSKNIQLVLDILPLYRNPKEVEDFFNLISKLDDGKLYHFIFDQVEKVCDKNEFQSVLTFLSCLRYGIEESDLTLFLKLNNGNIAINIIKTYLKGIFSSVCRFKMDTAVSIEIKKKYLNSDDSLEFNIRKELVSSVHSYSKDTTYLEELFYQYSVLNDRQSYDRLIENNIFYLITNFDSDSSTNYIRDYLRFPEKINNIDKINRLIDLVINSFWDYSDVEREVFIKKFVRILVRDLFVYSPILRFIDYCLDKGHLSTACTVDLLDEKSFILISTNRVLELAEVNEKLSFFIDNDKSIDNKYITSYLLYKIELTYTYDKVYYRSFVESLFERYPSLCSNNRILKKLASISLKESDNESFNKYKSLLELTCSQYPQGSIDWMTCKFDLLTLEYALLNFQRDYIPLESFAIDLQETVKQIELFYGKTSSITIEAIILLVKIEFELSKASDKKNYINSAYEHAVKVYDLFPHIHSVAPEIRLSLLSTYAVILQTDSLVIEGKSRYDLDLLSLKLFDECIEIGTQINANLYSLQYNKSESLLRCYQYKEALELVDQYMETLNNKFLLDSYFTYDYRKRELRVLYETMILGGYISPDLLNRYNISINNMDQFVKNNKSFWSQRAYEDIIQNLDFHKSIYSYLSSDTNKICCDINKYSTITREILSFIWDTNNDHSEKKEQSLNILTFVIKNYKEILNIDTNLPSFVNYIALLAPRDRNNLCSQIKMFQTQIPNLLKIIQD